MKKILALVSGFFLLSFGTAFALPFHWDVSTLGVTATGTPAVNGGNAVDFPSDMTTSGSSTIQQSLTGGADDTVLDDGDTFDEYGGLTILSSGGWPTFTGEEGFLLDSGDTKAYIVYEGLSGEIFNHDDGGTPTTGADTIGDDTFFLNFYAGVGDIAFYIDDDFDPTNGGATTKVADLELVQGFGTSPFPVLEFDEGQFGLVAEFTSVLDNFWYTKLFGDPTGQDLLDIINDPALAVFAASFNLGATLVSDSVFDNTDGEIEFRVLNEGSIEISVVPEPTTMLLFGFGLLGIAGATRRKIV